MFSVTVRFHCALRFCSAVWFWCIVARISNSIGPSSAHRFTILLLSHTDKLFTPHQRRLPPPEQHLSAISSLLSIFLSLSVFAFLPSLCFHPHLKVNCIPSLVQNPRVFLRCVKNKRPSFYVSCISLLCPLFSFSISFYL